MFEPHDNHNIPGNRLFDTVLFMRLHLKKARDLLFFLEPRIKNILTDSHGSRVDTQKNQSPPLHHRNFKKQSRQRLTVFGRPLDLFFGFRVLSANRRHFHWRGQKIDDRLKQRLNTFILKAAAA